jgi:hypothetical protein
MLREDLIWSIFVCLAKGAVMLELGVEDPSIEDRPDDWEPLIHFDLKPSNSKKLRIQIGISLRIIQFS